jgi:hypothetical protein
MKRIVIITLLLILISCTDKRKYLEWKLLFRYEGCNYYEIIENDKPFYLVDCPHKKYKVDPIEEVF